MELLEPAVKGVRVGDPALTDTEMGPLISASHRASVAKYVPDDAPVAFRGNAPDGPGYWFPPTVLAPIGSDAPACTEEIFGPVVTVTPFEDEAEALEIANDTPYGLSGSFWTGNIGRAIRVARAVETGNLSVNSHSSVRYWTRSADSSSPDWVASSDRTRSTRSPRSRTFLSPLTNGSRAMQRLENRVAVITGAGSGIGLASARRMAAEGAKVVAVDIDKAAGQAAAEETGGVFIAADVAVEDDVRLLYDDVATEFGRIDIAFNNLNVSPPEDDSILTTGIDAWRHVQVNGLGLPVLQYVLPHMQRQGRARSSTRLLRCRARSATSRSPTPHPRAACWR